MDVSACRTVDRSYGLKRRSHQRMGRERRRRTRGVVIVGALVEIVALTVALALERPLLYRVEEERPLGTVVITDIAKDAGLTSRYTVDVLRMLSYIILTQSDFREFFHLEERSGRMRTVAVIDREVICRQQTICTVRLDIAVHPAKYFEVIKIEIEVEDINDHAPVFAPSRLSLSLLESTQPKELFPIIPATDADSPVNAVVGYQLISASDRFDLRVGPNASTTGHGAADLRLVLLRGLDRETEALYELQLLAVDAGHPPMTGTLSIDINIIDVNDNIPRFENLSYVVSMSEDLPVGSTVVRVQAVDPDDGRNGKIRYQFSRRTQAALQGTDDGDVFSIDRESGDIVLRRPVSGLGRATFNLAVIAEDEGENSVPVMVPVVVSLQDVNEHTPTISVNGDIGQGASVIEVAEQGYPNMTVAMVTASDADRGSNGQVRCSMDSAADDDDESTQSFAIVQLYESEYKIVARRAFSRGATEGETAEEGTAEGGTAEGRTVEAKTVDGGIFHLTIVCWDLGTPPLETTRNVTVVIVDVSIDSPQFESGFYEATLRENNSPNEFIVQVQAKDRDRQRKAKVNYSLEPHTQGRFQVDSETGVVVASIAFDREAEPFHEFHVVAWIRGTEERFASRALVRLTVLDVDDEVPKFEQSTYVFEVPEDLSLRSEVGQVVAVDRDLDPLNVAFSYFLFVRSEDGDRRTIGGGGGRSLFAIDAATGSIFLIAPLDRETLERHSLVARVRSTSGALSPNGVYPQTLQSTFGGIEDDAATVEITVLDCNDNAPRFLFPSPSNNTVKISSSLAVGEIVTSVVARDDDVGLNAQLHYSIRNEALQQEFRIDHVTGVVRLMVNLSRRLLDRSAQPVVFRLTIGARDSGTSTTLNASAILRVEVDVQGGGDDDADDDDAALKASSDYRKLNARDGEFDENHVIIVVMAVAGCLVVLVAFGLVATLIRKSVDKAVDRKVIWSKVTTEADNQQQLQQQRLNSPTTTTKTTTAATKTTAGDNSAAVSLPSDADRNFTPEVSVEVSDIILTLESEPVSFATRQRLLRLSNHETSEKSSPTQSSSECCSCRLQSSPEAFPVATDDVGCSAIFTRKGSSSSSAMGRSSGGDCTSSCRHWEDGVLQQRVFTLPPPPSPPNDSSDSSFHVFHFPSVVDCQPTPNGGTLPLDRTTTSISPSTTATLLLRRSAHNTTNTTTTFTETSSNQRTSAVHDCDDDDDAGGDDDSDAKDNHRRRHHHHRLSHQGDLGVVAIAVEHRKSDSYSAMHPPPPPLPTLPPHPLLPSPPQSTINSRDSRSRRVHFAGHVS